MSWRNLLSSRVQADAETDEAALKRAPYYRICTIEKNPGASTVRGFEARPDSRPPARRQRAAARGVGGPERLDAGLAAPAARRGVAGRRRGRVGRAVREQIAGQQQPDVPTAQEAPAATAAPTIAPKKKKAAEISAIDVAQLSLEYLKEKNLDSLKAHLKVLKLKVGGKKEELCHRIMEHHAVQVLPA